MILIDILPNEINKPQCPEFYIHNCRFHWRNIHGRREFILLSIALLFRKELSKMPELVFRQLIMAYWEMKS